MEHSNGSQNWVRAVPTLDLATASKNAIEEAIAAFWKERDARKVAGTLPANPFDRGDGWYTVTPQMAEAALMRTSGNRPMVANAIKAYAADMTTGQWQQIGYDSQKCRTAYPANGAR